MTGNWGMAAASVEDMLRESATRTLGVEDLDEEELFDHMYDMPGVFKTSLPKMIDRSKLEAWDQTQPS